jgi:hypothetical protein
MKVTVELPEKALLELIATTGASTAQEAILVAVTEFNRHCRMAALVRHAGQGDFSITPESLQAARRGRPGSA